MKNLHSDLHHANTTACRLHLHTSWKTPRTLMLCGKMAKCCLSATARQKNIDELKNDGLKLVDNFMRDAQFVFSRVQHHCYQKTSMGYVPFKACKVKQRGKCKSTKVHVCKADCPKTKLLISATRLVCRGLAKKHGLRTKGRRNQLGNMIGKRACEWQSGTHPAFAILFRSNSHTLPNYRAPLLSCTHDDDACDNKECKDSCLDSEMNKKLAKLSQRVCRECTGYHSGHVQGAACGRQVSGCCSRDFELCD